MELVTASSQKKDNWCTVQGAASQVFFACCMRAPAVVASHGGSWTHDLGSPTLSRWWGANSHLPMDRHSSRRSSLLSSCSLWGQTTLTRKYAWQRPHADTGHLHVVISAVMGLACPFSCALPSGKNMTPSPTVEASTFFRKIDWSFDVKSIYYSPSVTAEDLLMIILLLYNCERAFHLKSVVVSSCWSEETLGIKIYIEARLPQVLLGFSKTVCSSSAHWGLQINLSSPALVFEQVRVQSHIMLCNLNPNTALETSAHSVFFSLLHNWTLDTTIL